MILRAGFETFEFSTGQQKQRNLDSISFASRDEALRWLKHLGCLHSTALIRLRDYVRRYWEDPETYRVTNHYGLERMAELLYLRRIVVIYSLHLTSSGELPSAEATAAPAFPLSERTQRAASAPAAPPPVNDPPTFSPNVDQSAQAAALVSAAADGKAFCPE